MGKKKNKIDWPKVERMLSNWWGSEKTKQYFLQEISKAAEAGREVKVTDTHICYVDENGERCYPIISPGCEFGEIPSQCIEPQSIEQAKKEAKNGGKGDMFKHKLENYSLENRLHKEPASIFARLQEIEQAAEEILDREKSWSKPEPETKLNEDTCAAVRALDLVGEIRELWNTCQYEKAAIAMFDLGRESILMPALMFNKPAAGGVRASVNAEAQQAKRMSKKLPGATLLDWYNRQRAKKPEDLIETTHEKLAEAIEKYEGRKITADAVKKRLDKHKKTLGKVI